MFGFLMRYPQLIASVVGLIILIMGGAYIHHKGYSSCEADNLKKSVSIKEKQDEIATHRPDTDALLDSLRNGSF